MTAAGGGPDLTYSWTTTGGTLSSSTGSEVRLDTTDMAGGSATVTLRVSTSRTSCDRPCPGDSCSVSVEVESIPEIPIIVPCGPLYFPFNSARINNEHKACLFTDVALRLLQNPRSVLVIDGHRDSSERVGISLTRANNARDALVREGNVSAEIIVRNFGDTCPDASGRPEFNRKVEMWVLPEGTSISQIDQRKRCAPGSSPRVITTEEPAEEPRPAPRRRTPRRTEPISEADEAAEDSSELETVEPTARPAATYAPARNERSGHQPSMSPATAVRSVKASMLNGVLRVVIETDGAAQFKAFSLAAPSRIVVDLAGLRHAFGSKVMQVDSYWVDRVRIGEPGAGMVRIVLDVKEKVSYRVIREGASLVIIVGDAALVSRFGGSDATPLATIQ